MTDLARYSGNVYLGRIDSSGNFQGFFPPVEVNAFTPGRELGDAVTITSKKRETYGQTIFSEQEASSYSLTLEILEQPAWVLQAAFAASSSQISVSGASVTDEDVLVRDLDTIYKLANVNVDSGSAFTLTNEAGDTTYVLDTDYEIVDHRVGLIKPLSSGSIAANTTLHVDYTYLSLAGTKLLGEQVQATSFRVFADMQNRINNKDKRVLYHQVDFTAPDIFDLFSDEVISITLSGQAVTPTGKSSPYEIELID